MQPPSPSSVLDGKYQLSRRLGEGGMGAVYEGLHLGTGRRVAVKVIASEALARKPDLVSRFQREAMASGAIESQYIAQVLDTGRDPVSGSPYMVMELLTGEDVEHALRRLGPLPPELALRVAAQACLGLQKAHDRNVVHRDIKPANLYLAERDGGERVVKILDFGIAKMREEPGAGAEKRGLTQTGTMLGSPLYMSPEQAYGRRSIDHRTDVWSLGVVLYEALSGATPHAHAETIGELIICICQQPPRLVQELAPWVRPEVAAIVHRALALDPNARFATAKEMFDAIRAVLGAGHAIDDSMLVALSPGARAVAAPPLLVTSDVRAPSPSMASAPQAAAAVTGGASGGGASTAVGFAQSSAAGGGASAKGKRGAIGVVVGVAAVAAIVAAAGTAAVLARGRGHDASPAAGGASTPVATASVAATAISTVAKDVAPPPVVAPPPAPPVPPVSVAPVASASSAPVVRPAPHAHPAPAKPAAASPARPAPTAVNLSSVR